LSSFAFVKSVDDCQKPKSEMTLDCFILRSSSFFTNSDHPQSRVISVHSWYLTCFNLSFYGFDLAFLSVSSSLLSFTSICFDRFFLKSVFSLVIESPSGFSFRFLFACNQIFLCSVLPVLRILPFSQVACLVDSGFSLQVLLDSKIPISVRFLPGLDASCRQVSDLISGFLTCSLVSPFLLSGFIIRQICPFFKPAFYTKFHL